MKRLLGIVVALALVGWMVFARTSGSHSEVAGVSGYEKLFASTGAIIPADGWTPQSAAAAQQALQQKLIGTEFNDYLLVRDFSADANGTVLNAAPTNEHFEAFHLSDCLVSASLRSSEASKASFLKPGSGARVSGVVTGVFVDQLGGKNKAFLSLTLKDATFK